LVLFKFVIPAKAGIQEYWFLGSGFPFSREWHPRGLDSDIGQTPNLDKSDVISMLQEGGFEKEDRKLTYHWTLACRRRKWRSQAAKE
jgi:hypothetical protein